ncbi:alcohol dehydrogenase 3-like [Triticum aestivum]|uniref:alcohol dehydrogenase 3-like n=1 Tax=Triticum aestivum TaxID=4565 RepID=UPI001D00DB91|nr:alcohol dehydrogenase 3-like [Triticum aestivum]
MAGNVPSFPLLQARGDVHAGCSRLIWLDIGTSIFLVRLLIITQCKECARCNLCDLLRINVIRGMLIDYVPSRFTISRKPISVFVRTSTFSDYSECLVKRKGSTMVIFGLGVVSLVAMEVARMARASSIISVDLNPAKYVQAKKFGCTVFVNPKDHISSLLLVLVEMTNSGGNRAVDCTCHIHAMISSFECVHDTRADIEIGAETETGMETGAEIETGAETSGAGIEPKTKRQ